MGVVVRFWVHLKTWKYQKRTDLPYSDNWNATDEGAIAPKALDCLINVKIKSRFANIGGQKKNSVEYHSDQAFQRPRPLGETLFEIQNITLNHHHHHYHYRHHWPSSVLASLDRRMSKVFWKQWSTSSSQTLNWPSAGRAEVDHRDGDTSHGSRHVGASGCPEPLGH